MKTEANEGLQRGTLVPAQLDDTKPPLGFRHLESAQLQRWTGEAIDPEVMVLTEGIARHVAPGPRAESIEHSVREPDAQAPAAVPAVSNGHDAAGARAWLRTLLPRVSEDVLTRMAEGRPVKAVKVGVDDQSQFTYAIE